MRSTLVLVAIVALAAAWCQPAASQPTEQVRVPADVRCDKQGHPVEIRVLMPEAGVLTLQLPPNICAAHQEPPAPAQRPRPASSSPPMI